MNNFEISEEIIVEVTLNNLWHFVAFYSATSAGNLFGFLTFVIVKNVKLISLIKHPDICQGNRTKKVRWNDEFNMNCPRQARKLARLCHRVVLLSPAEFTPLCKIWNFMLLWIFRASWGHHKLCWTCANYPLNQDGIFSKWHENLKWH